MASGRQWWRPDRYAPDWLVLALQPSTAPIPWGPAIRIGLAATILLTAGLLAGHLAEVMPAALAVLLASANDRSEVYRARLLRIGIPALAGAAGMMIGYELRGERYALGVLVALIFVSGVTSVAGPVTSSAGLQFTVTSVLGYAMPLAGPHWAITYLAGAALLLLLTLVVWPFSGQSAERAAVAGAFEALVHQLAVIGTDSAIEARRTTTAAFNNAYDSLLGYRLRTGARSDEERHLLELLNAGTLLGESAQALLWEGKPVPDRVVVAVFEVSDAIREGRQPVIPPKLPGDTPGLRSLRAALAEVADPGPAHLTRHGTPGAARPGRVAATLRRMVQPPALLFGTRLALCMGIALVVAGMMHEERSYWLPTTVAFVLKPDLGSVFARAIQRSAGTLIGVAIAGLILAAAPSGWPMVPVVIGSMILVPVSRVRGYGMATVAATPCFLFLIDLSTDQGAGLLGTRIADTLAGCLIVLVAGYLLWPETWNARVGPRFAAAVRGVAAYLDGALRDGDQAERVRLRRQAYRGLADARAAVEQALAEPPPASTRASAWWPAVVALENVTDAITASAVHGGAGETEVAQLSAVLNDLAASVVLHHRPANLPLPEVDDPDDALADVVEQVRTARLVVAGPEQRG
ncbi:FUSC family protein [Longispora albida]|uniref:FUSC family protein n=1 Tax=Longispora albida TaxID=203523 RepID=UPI00039AAEA7|nr:FUSC family protein [Longispora albida]